MVIPIKLSHDHAGAEMPVLDDQDAGLRCRVREADA
jgi:hypothetical protein